MKQKLLPVVLGLFFFAISQMTLSAQDRWKMHPDHPGVWSYKFYTEAKGGYRSELSYSLSPDELARFKQKISDVAETLHQNPVVKNPIGFEPTVQGNFWTDVFPIHYDVRVLANQIPQAEIVIRFCPFYSDKEGNPEKACMEVEHCDIMLNNPRHSVTGRETNGNSFDPSPGDIPTTFNEVFQAPPKIKELAEGVTVYSNGVIVVADPKRPYWIPVTCGEYFNIRLNDLERRINDPGAKEIRDMILKEKEQFTPDQLNQPAYNGYNPISLIGWEKNDRPYMRFNPEYFDKSLPREAVQLITIHALADAYYGECLYENFDYVSFYKFTKELDGESLRALLDIK
jgi:hypothetical protein